MPVGVGLQSVSKSRGGMDRDYFSRLSEPFARASRSHEMNQCSFSSVLPCPWEVHRRFDCLRVQYLMLLARLPALSDPPGYFLLSVFVTSSAIAHLLLRFLVVLISPVSKKHGEMSMRDKIKSQEPTCLLPTPSLSPCPQYRVALEHRRPRLFGPSR